jgi:hypothetical protein
MHLVLDDGCFANGQLYTALSRVRSEDGLTLVRPIQQKDVIYSPEVNYF